MTPQGEELSVPSESLKRIVENTERAVIRKMFKQYGDSLEAKKIIAGQLGISLATLYNKAKLNIKKRDFSRVYNRNRHRCCHCSNRLSMGKKLYVWYSYRYSNDFKYGGCHNSWLYSS